MAGDDSDEPPADDSPLEPADRATDDSSFEWVRSADDADEPRADEAEGDGDTAGADDRIPMSLGNNSTASADTYSPESDSTPVLPGDPSPEHVAFVLLGAVTMILVLVRLSAIIVP
jgi:hypothetical protein